MLDGKRYYRAFPDENPERSRVRAVLDALQELETQFRKHITQYRPNRLDPISPIVINPEAICPNRRMPNRRAVSIGSRTKARSFSSVSVIHPGTLTFGVVWQAALFLCQLGMGCLLCMLERTLGESVNYVRKLAKEKF